MSLLPQTMADHKTTLPDHVLFNDNHVDFWVFAYGSLMWNPGFEYTERQPATLNGYSRELCIYSWVHRGTRETPGLVFGLNKGGDCDGFAFNIPKHARKDTVAMLRERELVTSVYQETFEPLKLTGETPRIVKALFYIAVQHHEQYAGNLDRDDQIRLIKQGVGKSGINSDYILNTQSQLVKEGIHDENLSLICEQINAES